MNEIMLSVVVITYQHAKYIQQTLESILMQNVKFKYEILIGDDGSDDGTQEILKEYKKQYKAQINICLRKKNIGATQNSYRVLKCAKGKYIAICDGDDYWTNPDKLQLQVEFLEANDTYAAVMHKTTIVDEAGNRVRNNFDGYFRGARYRIKELETGVLPGQTSTIVFYNIYKDSKQQCRIHYLAHPLVGDQTLYAMLLCIGDIYCMKETMGCYRLVVKEGRKNAATVATMNNISLEMFAYYKKLEKYFEKVFHVSIDFSKQKNGEIYRAIKYVNNNPSLKNYKVLIKLYMFLQIEKIKLFKKTRIERWHK